MKKTKQKKQQKNKDSGAFIMIMQGIFWMLEMMVNVILYTIKGISFLIKKFRQKRYKDIYELKEDLDAQYSDDRCKK